MTFSYENGKKMITSIATVVGALLLFSRSFVAEASTFVITPSTGTATIVTPTSGAMTN